MEEILRLLFLLQYTIYATHGFNKFGRAFILLG